MKTELTIRCDCTSEHLDIDLYLDLDEEAGYMSFSSKWFGPHRPWRERFRAVWLILRGKSYYFDELIFDPDKLKQIRDFLIENLGNHILIETHAHKWEDALGDVNRGQICFECGTIKPQG